MFVFCAKKGDVTGNTSEDGNAIVAQTAEDADNLAYINITEEVLVDGLEMAQGLSGLAKGADPDSIIKHGKFTSVFCERPLLSSSGGFAKAPRIIKYADGDMTVLYEFQAADTADFSTGVRHVTTGGLRPVGLVLETAVLPDSSVLFTTNITDKIYRITSGGNKEVYLENDALMGTTGMIMGDDGKVYCAQVPFYYIFQDVVVRKKRVISIDSGMNIKVEFELPDRDYRSGWGHLINGRTDTGAISMVMGNLIKVTENTAEGKRINDPSKFYASDMLSHVIYKVSDAGVVNVLKEGIWCPSSMQVGKLGKVFVTTGTLLDAQHNVIPGYLPKLVAVNPKTDKAYDIYVFKEENSYQTGFSEVVSGGEIPMGFSISSILFEGDTRMEFYFTNTFNGKFKKMLAEIVFNQ